MQGSDPSTVSGDLDRLFRVGTVAETSDAELLDRFTARRRGDGEAAFEEIVRRHGPMVLGVCRRIMSDREAAEDAFQATFLVLAMRADAIRRRESLGPWLHGVAARVARRSLQSSRRRRELHLADDLPAEDSSDEFNCADLRPILDEELGRLPDKYRRPMILCYLEGQSQEQAARVLGWTKGTVSGRLARAKELLRGRLSRRGIAPASASAILAALLAPRIASAGVPASLSSATSRAAAAVGLAGAEAGSASGHVLNLAQGVVRTMVVLRVQVALPVLGVLLALACAAYGLWGPHYNGPANRPRLMARPQPRPLVGHVVGVGFTPAGMAVSADSDGRVRFWGAPDGGPSREMQLLEAPDGGTPSLTRFTLSEDGRWMAGSGQVRGRQPGSTFRGVWIWSVEPLRFARRIETGQDVPEALSFSPEGASLATGAEAGRIQLWDVSSGDELLSLRLGDSGIRDLAFSPDGMTLAATNEDSGVQLWDLGGGRALGALETSAEVRAEAPCFSGDGRLVGFGTSEGKVTIRDRSGRRADVTTSLGIRGPLRLCFAPDGMSLAAFAPAEGAIFALDSASGTIRWRSGLGALQAESLAYSADGRRIVIAGDVVPRFIDTGTGHEDPARGLEP